MIPKWTFTYSVTLQQCNTTQKNTKSFKILRPSCNIFILTSPPLLSCYFSPIQQHCGVQTCNKYWHDFRILYLFFFFFSYNPDENQLTPVHPYTHDLNLEIVRYGQEQRKQPNNYSSAFWTYEFYYRRVVFFREQHIKVHEEWMEVCSSMMKVTAGLQCAADGFGTFFWTICAI